LISCEISLPNLALRKELRETQLQLPEKRQAGATRPNDSSSYGFLLISALPDKFFVGHKLLWVYGVLVEKSMTCSSE